MSTHSRPCFQLKCWNNYTHKLVTIFFCYDKITQQKKFKDEQGKMVSVITTWQNLDSFRKQASEHTSGDYVNYIH